MIAAVGDGSYYFGNPLAYHYVGRAEKLPTLTIIANNHAWHAVRQATRDVYPQGHAAKANTMPLVELNPAPDFEMVAESCGGHRRKGDDAGRTDAGAPPRLRGDPLRHAGAAQRNDAKSRLSMIKSSLAQQSGGGRDKRCGKPPLQSLTPS